MPLGSHPLTASTPRMALVPLPTKSIPIPYVQISPRVVHRLSTPMLATVATTVPPASAPNRARPATIPSATRVALTSGICAERAGRAFLMAAPTAGSSESDRAHRRAQGRAATVPARHPCVSANSAMLAVRERSTFFSVGSVSEDMTCAATLAPSSMRAITSHSERATWCPATTAGPRRAARDVANAHAKRSDDWRSSSVPLAERMADQSVFSPGTQSGSATSHIPPSLSPARCELKYGSTSIFFSFRRYIANDTYCAVAVASAAPLTPIPRPYRPPYMKNGSSTAFTSPPAYAADTAVLVSPCARHVPSDTMIVRNAGAANARTRK
mmetsp:Transcript_12591/g.25180  ORF Transcript_12591/g.25180 Transcript_12591/m.25180 type:complete len:327 (+) Transcript_12591:355-1335(+)